MPEVNDPETQKRIVKEAIKEWMDEKFIEFGKWTMTSIAVAAIGALMYFILVSNGWHNK